MANQLSKTGISDNSTIYAYHITQSIDALTGAAPYDLTISGSLNLTGSFITGSLTGSLLGTASYAVSAAYAPSSNGVASVALNVSASYDANGGGFVDGQFKTYIGSFNVTGIGAYYSTANSAFNGKTIGTNMFVIASSPKSSEQGTTIFPVNINSNRIAFDVQGDVTSGIVNWVAYVLQ